MKWFNVLIDGPPAHEQRVLVSIDGIYYLAVYDAHNKNFNLHEEKRVIPAHAGTIYWAHLSTPDEAD